MIEREFGPFDSGAFRLDVSAPISDGESWQLGVFLAHALAENKQTHGAYVSENLRRHNGFEIHSVDGDEYFIGIARDRLPEDLRELVHFQLSDVVVGEFSNRICTYYRDLPNICPDLIYLDAPNQFIAKGHVRGVTTAHLDRMPMAADLLAI